MRKTWIISDEHYNHTNIINLCNRPFKDVEEMNESIIKNHNNVVKNGHLVIHLGDFCFGNGENIKSILERLNGDHVIVLGNHDHKSSKKYFEAGFQEVYKYPVIMEDFYILSHQPTYLNTSMPYVNIHGHLHDTEMSLLNDDKNMYYNACVEKNNYKPIDFEKIKSYYTKNLTNN